MARARDRLTVKSVEALKTPGLHADGGGLYLNVKKSGARSWCYIYQWQGRRREAGLGPLHIVSLQDARDKRDELRRKVRDGVDPLAASAATVTAPTFGAAATLLVDTLETGWSKPQVSRTIPPSAAAIPRAPCEHGLTLRKAELRMDHERSAVNAGKLVILQWDSLGNSALHIAG